jgi:hypothetical protein
MWYNDNRKLKIIYVVLAVLIGIVWVARMSLKTNEYFTTAREAEAEVKRKELLYECVQAATKLLENNPTEAEKQAAIEAKDECHRRYGP